MAADGGNGVRPGFQIRQFDEVVMVALPSLTAAVQAVTKSATSGLPFLNRLTP